MSLRLDFVHEALLGRVSMVELCARYGISQNTGYKWRARFLAGGPAALDDRSHAPHTCPHRVAPALEELLLAARERHPTWGARKLRVELCALHPDVAWPAPSTLTAALGRHGRLTPRRRRTTTPALHPTAGLTRPATPNELWTVDFKGHFRTGDGRYCYPLTVLDGASRHLLACRARGRIHGGETRATFSELFATYGLPLAIRSDNGVPFATTGLRGLSALNVWWVRLGIRLERIHPGCPGENGAHERFHRTLKAETTRPPAADRRAQQRRFDRFQTEYNTVRPHEALGQVPPATCYTGSPRPYPDPLPPLSYPAWYERRAVSANGAFRWSGRAVFLSKALTGQVVGLDSIAADQWAVYFGTMVLGCVFTPGSVFVALENLPVSPINPV